MFTFNSIAKIDDRIIVRLELNIGESLSKFVMASINNACDSVEDAGQGTVLLVHLKGVSDTTMAELSEPVNVNVVNQWERALRRLERLDATTIATIDGACTGLGLAVMLTTDYRITARDVRLNARIGAEGIMPGMVLHRMANQIGVAQSRRMALFGMEMTADHAESIGLVDEVVDDTESAVAVFLRALGSLETSDLAVRRRLLLDASPMSYEDGLGSHLAACDRFLRKAHRRDDTGAAISENPSCQAELSG